MSNSIEYCDKCGKMLYLEIEKLTHKCKPYKIEDEDGDISEMYGGSVEDALERYAEKRNEENELIDNEITVKVDGVEYVLSAEIDVRYSICEV